jgi:hypothetical protein
MTQRIHQEQNAANGNVLFAVMALEGSYGPVLAALQNLHKEQKVYSYGISDTPGGIELYKPVPQMSY